MNKKEFITKLVEVATGEKVQNYTSLNHGQLLKLDMNTCLDVIVTCQKSCLVLSATCGEFESKDVANVEEFLKNMPSVQRVEIGPQLGCKHYLIVTYTGAPLWQQALRIGADPENLQEDLDNTPEPDKEDVLSYKDESCNKCPLSVVNKNLLRKKLELEYEIAELKKQLAEQSEVKKEQPRVEKIFPQGWLGGIIFG